MKKSITYLFLILALLINAILPAFLAHDNFRNADTKALEELSGKDGKVLICTSYGYKYVSIAELEEENKKPSNNKPSCPICVLASSNTKAFTPHIAELDLQYSRIELISFFIFNDEIKIDNNISYKSPRAPPVFS